MPRSRISSFVAAALGIGLAVTGVLTAAAAATAATETYPDAISHVELSFVEGEGGPTRVGQWLVVTADWAVPDSAVGGETFGMTLPTELRRVVDAAFELKNAAGDVVGSCVISDDDLPVLTCTLTDFVNDRDDVHGSVWFKAEAVAATTASTLAFEDGGAPILADIPGEGGIVQLPDRAVVSAAKVGWQSAQDGRWGWMISVPSGLAEDGRFTVADTLVPGGPDAESHSLVGSLDVSWRPVDEDGNLAGPAVGVPAADIVENTYAAGQKSFSLIVGNVPADQKRVYQIQYLTAPDGAFFRGDTYRNDALVESTKASGSFTYTGFGGGIGDGDAYTRFSIAKSVSGDAASSVPAGTVFTVEYEVAGETRTLPITVGEGNRAMSERYPIGSTFVISEIDIPAIDGVVWRTHTIAGAGVVDNGDGTYAITPGSSDPVALVLENVADRAAVPTGNLSVTKHVTGDGAALLPDGTAYTVHYEYGVDGDTVRGDLSIADGRTAALPEDIPVGTAVTLTEARPADVTVADGVVQYGRPTFRVAGADVGPTATVTVTDASQPVAVTVENPTVVHPRTPPTPPASSTPPATPPTHAPANGDLAQTGSSFPAGTAAVVGLALLLAGAWAAARRSRARH